MKLKKSNFKKSTFMEDMKILFSTHKESILVVSYKSPGITSINDLELALKETHKTPYTHSTEHTYSLNKNNGHYLENLIVAYPKR